MFLGYSPLRSTEYYTNVAVSPPKLTGRRGEYVHIKERDDHIKARRIYCTVHVYRYLANASRDHSDLMFQATLSSLQGHSHF